MSSATFEPAIPAIKHPQTYAWMAWPPGSAQVLSLNPISLLNN